MSRDFVYLNIFKIKMMINLYFKGNLSSLKFPVHCILNRRELNNVTLAFLAEWCFPQR